MIGAAKGDIVWSAIGPQSFAAICPVARRCVAWYDRPEKSLYDLPASKKIQEDLSFIN